MVLASIGKDPNHRPLPLPDTETTKLTRWRCPRMQTCGHVHISLRYHLKAFSCNYSILRARCCNVCQVICCTILKEAPEKIYEGLTLRLLGLYKLNQISALKRQLQFN